MIIIAKKMYISKTHPQENTDREKGGKYKIKKKENKKTQNKHIKNPTISTWHLYDCFYYFSLFPIVSQQLC